MKLFRMLQRGNQILWYTLAVSMVNEILLRLFECTVISNVKVESDDSASLDYSNNALLEIDVSEDG